MSKILMTICGISILLSVGCMPNKRASSNISFMPKGGSEVKKLRRQNDVLRAQLADLEEKARNYQTHNYELKEREKKITDKYNDELFLRRQYEERIKDLSKVIKNLHDQIVGLGGTVSRPKLTASTRPKIRPNPKKPTDSFDKERAKADQPKYD